MPYTARQMVGGPSAASLESRHFYSIAQNLVQGCWASAAKGAIACVHGSLLNLEIDPYYGWARMFLIVESRGKKIFIPRDATL